MATIPPKFRAGAQRVSDMVRGMFPRLQGTASPAESDLRIHLCGNEKLFTALNSLIVSRIEGRARLPLPSDPLQCYGSMARDKELRWLLGQLDYLYNAPADEQYNEDGERPAA